MFSDVVDGKYFYSSRLCGLIWFRFSVAILIRLPLMQIMDCFVGFKSAYAGFGVTSAVEGVVSRRSLVVHYMAKACS